MITLLVSIGRLSITISAESLTRAYQWSSFVLFQIGIDVTNGADIDAGYFVPMR
jgi:hypothetical protein